MIPFLAGGFLFLKEKTTSQDAANKSLAEAWRDAGEKFLRRRKSKICSSESTGPYQGITPEDEKQKEAYSTPRGKKEQFFSQIPSKKITTPKQTAAAQTTPQSPQKQSREREE